MVTVAGLRLPTSWTTASLDDPTFDISADELDDDLQVISDLDFGTFDLTTPRVNVTTIAANDTTAALTVTDATGIIVSQANWNINGNQIINTGTLTLPTSTDTLVGRATTDTLTNKQFEDDSLVLQNPADTFNYTIQTSAIVAARTVTIPLLTAAGNFAIDSFSNTFSTSQTFSDFVDFTEISVPGAPAANNLRMYAIDEATVSHIEFQNSGGTKFPLQRSVSNIVASATTSGAVNKQATDQIASGTADNVDIIAAMVPVGTALIREGTYNIQAQVGPSAGKRILKGDGIGATVFQRDVNFDGVSSRPLSVSNQDHITMRDFTIDGNNANVVGGASESSQSELFLLNADDCNFNNIEIKNTNTAGVALNSCERITFFGLTVTDANPTIEGGRGMSFNVADTIDTTVSGGIFKDNVTQGILANFVHRMTVMGSHFVNNATQNVGGQFTYFADAEDGILMGSHFSGTGNNSQGVENMGIRTITLGNTFKDQGRMSMSLLDNDVVKAGTDDKFGLYVANIVKDSGNVGDFAAFETIHVLPGTDQTNHFIVALNMVDDQRGTPHTTYGARIRADSDEFIIMGNDFIETKTGGILDDSTGTVKQIVGNLPFNSNTHLHHDGADAVISLAGATGHLEFGATPADAGAPASPIRLSNATGISVRNVGDTDNFDYLFTEVSGEVPVVNHGGTATKQLLLNTASATAATSTTLDFNQTSSQVVTFPDATFTVLGDATTATLTNKDFEDNGLVIQNPADTFSYTFQAGAILAARQITLPVLTATSTMAFADFANAWGTQNQDIAATGKWQEAGVNISPIGLHDKWFGVKEMFLPSTTPAAAIATREPTASQPAYEHMAFITAADEVVMLQWTPPRNWDEGTVTAIFYWTAFAGVGNVIWDISGLAIGQGEAINQAFPAATAATADGFDGTNDHMHLTARTTAHTIGGTPATSDHVIFRIRRNGAAGGDTHTADANLIGVSLEYSIDAGVAA